MVFTVCTGLPLIVLRTGAVEIPQQAVAGRLVLTRVGLTRIRMAWYLTERSNVARQTFTYKAVQQHVTLAGILARAAGTLVPLDLTVGAREAWGTLAMVASSCSFLTSCSILALSMAAIHVDVTVLSGPSLKAVTMISTNQVFARVSVNARLPHTLIYINLAGLPSPLRRTETLKAILQIDTRSPLSTRTGSTLIHVFSTGGTLPAWRTVAFKARGNFMTGATIGTRVGNAGMLCYFTVLARVAFRTGTVIFVWLGVDAGTSVHTGVMGATVVQIFITQ